ncbi:hypothetical protein NPA08_04365 [Mycoplasmopsis citelli]|uniref:Uncharacterized protein n=1 Tax=Mycoplasmopsis citelli TaxID=171281 RepID=A0A449B2J0_9BACT|nr:hypothetical protein [Mycoplasmopsis citelli]UUD36154.1 hypothetical protein NPA08_04365 [Mycoplasmopsis citelli]VEU74796.1 Uncharacterised protein [Mycoplasmopsis citelli]
MIKEITRFFENKDDFGVDSIVKPIKSLGRSIIEVVGPLFFYAIALALIGVGFWMYYKASKKVSETKGSDKKDAKDSAKNALLMVALGFVVLLVAGIITAIILKAF